MAKTYYRHITHSNIIQSPSDVSDNAKYDYLQLRTNTSKLQ